MRTRLLVRLVLAAILLLIVLAMRLVNPTRVTFSPANMSIDPGKGWKVVKTPATQNLCSPILVSPSGRINALLLDEEITEVKTASVKVQANLVAAGTVSPDAFKEEEFTTASGLAGIHLAYTGLSAPGGMATVRGHYFITHNMRGRYLSISYTTAPQEESSTLIAAIMQTLRVE